VWNSGCSCGRKSQSDGRKGRPCHTPSARLTVSSAPSAAPRHAAAAAADNRPTEAPTQGTAAAAAAAAVASAFLAQRAAAGSLCAPCLLAPAAPRSSDGTTVHSISQWLHPRVHQNGALCTAVFTRTTPQSGRIGTLANCEGLGPWQIAVIELRQQAMRTRKRLGT
jgi:hypothetical protein